jgi:molybdopterin molybdotransferase
MPQPAQAKATPPGNSGAAARVPSARESEPLASVGEVAALILAATRVLPAVTMPLPQTAGRVLAEPVIASMPLPRFDNAAMDGYAVRTSDVAGASVDAPTTLRLVAPSSAGQPTPPELPVGCACPIATGAPMPAGGDAVIMLEYTIEHGGKVLASRPVDRGQHVRWRGEDVAVGTELLHAGQVVTAGQIVAAAALGRTALRVRRPPRVTIVLTGTEVVSAGQPLADHQVFDAVGPALHALLADVGCMTATLGPVDDDPWVLAATLLNAAEDSDALITVGGASVGRHDHLKQVLSRHGDLHAWRVALRPAKPFVFGAIAGIPLFGLPGNPASALAAYEVFVRPALLAMQGRADHRLRLQAQLTEPFSQPPGRLHLVRGQCWMRADRWLVRPVGAQGAGMVHALAAANAWMVVPADVDHLPAGVFVEVWSMSGQAPAQRPPAAGPGSRAGATTALWRGPG